jgi:hypothetical protein
MDPASYGFFDEFEFYDAALIDPAVGRGFRTYIGLVAREVVDQIIKQNAMPRSVRGRLVAAAMTPFERALQLYEKRRQAGYGHPFSRYYRWWARQYATREARRS